MILLAIALVAAFWPHEGPHDRDVRRLRTRVDIRTVPPPRPPRAEPAEPVIAKSYYAEAEPPAKVFAERQKPHRTALSAADPMPETASDAAPYLDGEKARHLTGEALRRALIVDKAITTQANIDAGAVRSSNVPGHEKGG